MRAYISLETAKCTSVGSVECSAALSTTKDFSNCFLHCADAACAYRALVMQLRPSEDEQDAAWLDVVGAYAWPPAPLVLG